MKLKTIIWTSIITLGLSLSVISVSQAKTESHKPNRQFSHIEQPIAIKVLVTLGGLGLIGAELWWFLVSQTQSQKATPHQGIQELEILVDGGYSPDKIQVTVNQPVRLKFLRKDPNSCLEKVLFPDFHKAVDLPLNQIQLVEFTPTKTGQYSFHCGMNMFRGIVEVDD